MPNEERLLRQAAPCLRWKHHRPSTPALRPNHSQTLQRQLPPPTPFAQLALSWPPLPAATTTLVDAVSLSSPPFSFFSSLFTFSSSQGRQSLGEKMSLISRKEPKRAPSLQRMSFLAITTATTNSLLVIPSHCHYKRHRRRRRHSLQVHSIGFPKVRSPHPSSLSNEQFYFYFVFQQALL